MQMDREESWKEMDAQVQTVSRQIQQKIWTEWSTD